MLRKISFTMILLTLCLGLDSKSFASWTERYTKAYALDSYNRKIVLSSTAQGWKVKPFSQLICCWNAQKPARGYFRFYARVRCQKTKRWLVWHTLADWGSSFQKSYTSEGRYSTHHFVRLELEPGCKADAFEIKIETRAGACLKHIQALCITTSSTTAITDESEHALKLLPSIYIRGVPTVSQWQVDHPEAYRLCSPTCLSMVLSYLVKQRVDPYHLAKTVYDEGLDAYGSWPFNMAAAFEASKGRYYFFVTRLQNFKELHTLIKKNLPIAVSVRGFLPGAPKIYEHGHLIVIVGYNARTKEVLCHDPAHPHANKVFIKYPLSSFLSAWQKSHRLAYVPQLPLLIKKERIV